MLTTVLKLKHTLPVLVVEGGRIVVVVTGASIYKIRLSFMLYYMCITTDSCKMTF
jgi:hypothetical protein